MQPSGARHYGRGCRPTRLRILQLLDSEGDLSVGEIASRLDVAIAGVSNHLACLRWCAFVATVASTARSSTSWPTNACEPPQPGASGRRPMDTVRVAGRICRDGRIRRGERRARPPRTFGSPLPSTATDRTPRSGCDRGVDGLRRFSGCRRTSGSRSPSPTEDSGRSSVTAPCTDWRSDEEASEAGGDARCDRRPRSGAGGAGGRRFRRSRRRKRVGLVRG